MVSSKVAVMLRLTPSVPGCAHEVAELFRTEVWAIAFNYDGVRYAVYAESLFTFLTVLKAFLLRSLSIPH